MGLTRAALIELRKAAEAKYLRDVARLRGCQAKLDANRDLAVALTREGDAAGSGDPALAQRAAWADRKRHALARENEAFEMALEKLKTELRASAGRKEAVSTLIDREEEARRKRQDAAEEDRQAVLTALHLSRS